MALLIKPLQHRGGGELAHRVAPLRRELGDAVHFVEPQGGYFFWLRLAANVDTAALLERAAPFQVSFRPGVRFSGSDGLRNYLRLSFAFYESAELEEGARRLGRLL